MNNKRLKKMMDLAMFEELYGKEDIQISRYFFADYLVLGLLQNFVLITIAYIIILGLIIIYNFDYFAMNFADMNLKPVIMYIIIVYAAILAFYSLIVIIIRTMKYNRAVSKMSMYDHKLKSLDQISAGGESVSAEKEGNKKDESPA